MPTPATASDLAPTGVLRAAINLGNPVLAQGTADDPAGVTVDLARELGRRLDVPVELVCSQAARLSFEAITTGRVDVCFLAVEPARATEVAFTEPYVLIEGVYVVPEDSVIRNVVDVDRDGVRIGVKEGSAYDLYLTRTLEHAEVVRGAEGVDVFAAKGLEVGAGIRQPVEAHAAAHEDLRLVDGAFMEIRQAMGAAIDRHPDAVAYLRAFVKEAKASGFVADSLRRSGQDPAAVAPAARP